MVKSAHTPSSNDCFFFSKYQPTYRRLPNRIAMLPSTSLSALALAALAAAAPVELATRTTCYSGVYVIGARGSDEDKGFGSTAAVVDAVLAAIPGSGSIALDYPASVLDPIYSSSVTDGIKTMKSLVQNYADNCGGKIVLIGFSQGGNVITDVLAGGILKPKPLTASYIDHSE